jgi:hypothetical protein
MKSGCDLLGELLPLNRKFKIILRGGSMHPFLKDGDVLEIDPAVTPLRKRDIVLYKLNGILFAHRITNIGPDCIVIRGDAAERTERIQSDQILGKALCRIRNGQAKDLQGFNANFYAKLLPFSRHALRAWYLLQKLGRWGTRES